jgi:ABC-type dipeptide/oligopeptide/nickel transport system ATPase component
MFLSSTNIKNFRSIVDSGEIRIERFQALVGENNCGKSNILAAINVFLTAGAGGVKEKDFFNSAEEIIIACTFTNLTLEERKQFRRYLLGDKLILEKHLIVAQDTRTQKAKVSAEYHGYLAKPKDWWLSTDGVIEEKNTTRPNWKNIAEEKGILEYVQTEDGKVNKTSYVKGLERLLLEKDDIEYDEPELGETQTLGLQTNLLAQLPDFYLLPAITDYSDEIDKRSTSTIFRKLMGDLGDRIIKLDPRYKEIETALNTIHSLFNSKQPDDDEIKRLDIIENIEDALMGSIKALIPRTLRTFPA